ncbi:MAG: hypothetical protein HXY40_18980 [Chloroflexi bacterium]|nr:hypothetical protein [Chloroflexota bacterium]
MKETLILYSGGLRGQLSLCPPLYTFLKTLRAEFGVAQAHDERRTLLVDVGEACATEVWHCAATGGRSTLIVLDAMGYHAANVAGYLTAEARAQLDGVVKLALVDAQPVVQDDLCFARDAHTHDGLTVVLTPASVTEIHEQSLRLARAGAGQVGVAHLSKTGALVAAKVLALPPRTPPDATIAGVVDFVESEARYFRKKRGE